ncbi:MAG TPA: hypothetical protein PK387_06395, partial [Mesotoga prima]|uniref:hypothetical protein n=1 Tax=Mesotoga prima TaxID=1184387 RepID=UPI002BBA30A5
RAVVRWIISVVLQTNDFELRFVVDFRLHSYSSLETYQVFFAQSLFLSDGEVKFKPAILARSHVVSAFECSGK